MTILDGDEHADLVADAKQVTTGTAARTIRNLRRARARNRDLRAALAVSAQSAEIAAREIRAAATNPHRGQRDDEQPF